MKQISIIGAGFAALSAARKLRALENLATVSGLVASLGKFNFLMSDGEHLIAYGHDRLHYLERFNSDQSDATQGNSVLVATEPLDENMAWTSFHAGELRLYRAGKMIGRMTTQTIPAYDAEQH